MIFSSFLDIQKAAEQMVSPVTNQPLCYLCGSNIEESQRTGDHVVQRTLLDHKDPKIPGFDYAGKLVTHAECNNQFGDERYVRKALELLGALRDPDTTLEGEGGEDGSIRFLALRSNNLTNFTKKDFQFFGIHDARFDDVASFTHRGFFENKQPVDPFKRPLFTTLSVLGKSAAALLVRKKLKSLPNSWNIIAFPYSVDYSKVDLTAFFGNTKPFGTYVTVWIKQFESKSWIALYVTKTAMVWFFFVMSDEFPPIEKIRGKFPDAQGFQFQGNYLMELVDYAWYII